MDLDNYKIRNELEKIKAALVKYTHDNEGLVTTISGLTPKNNILINDLIELWKTRETPTETEKNIIRVNLAYQANSTKAEELADVEFDPSDMVNEKRWVLKNREAWFGWQPHSHEYGVRPIEFGGDLDYAKWEIFVNLSCALHCPEGRIGSKAWWT